MCVLMKTPNASSLAVPLFENGDVDSECSEFIGWSNDHFNNLHFRIALEPKIIITRFK